jgi:hypothetical protein
VDQEVPATDVAKFVRNNCREFLFTKDWQQFAGEQDSGTKHSDSYGILDGCGFKESNPVFGVDDLADYPGLGRREYGCVSSQPMNSINSSAEAGQPKQNKNPPNANDPTLDPRWDCELPMLLE